MDFESFPSSRHAAHDLTKAEGFALGPLAVDPPARRIAAGERSEMLEPRVMRVLVALGQAGGKVMSRDDLIELCWDGTIVGDNAINRVIFRLRHALEDLSGGAVRLETIPRVGFRILAEGAPTPAQAATATDPPAMQPPHGDTAPDAVKPPRKRKWTRRAALAGGAMLGAAMGAEYFTRTTRAVHTPKPASLDLFRRGLDEANEAKPGWQQRAIALFRQAVAADPEHADAWAALAAAYRDSANPYAARPETTREQLAAWAARRALALEPDHPDALFLLLQFGYPHFGRWAEQEARLRAQTLRFPDSWRPFANLTRLLLDVGRVDEAIPVARRVVQINPAFVPGWCRLARNLHYAGRNKEADVVLEVAAKTSARNGMVVSHRFAFYIGSKRYAEAEALMNDRERRPDGVTPDMAEGQARLARVLASGQGKPDELERMRMNPYRFHVESAWMTTPFLAQLGDADGVFERLEIYFFGGEHNGERVPAPASRDERDTGVLFAPAILELKDDPRYLGLLQRIGLEDFWRKTGSQPDFRKSS